MRFVLSVVLAVFSSNFIKAADGVLEINQTCALNGGCFAGDTPGFPVLITTPGSYVLTSNLDLTSFPDTNAVEIAADGTRLDLGGFSIIGDITCTGSGSTLSCPSGSGVGVSSFSTGVSISNGTIRNMSRFGIAATGESVRVSDIFVRHNGAVGINVGPNGIIHGSFAQENDSSGFSMGNGFVVSHSTASGNSGDGFVLQGEGVVDHTTSGNNGERGYDIGLRGRFGSNNQSRFNVEPDLCSLGECTHLRKFYLSLNTFIGSQVKSACVGGFRPATAYELFAYQNLHYDRVLGDAATDRVGGPPNSRFGWAYQNNTNNGFSCVNWTSSSDTDSGTTFQLEDPTDWGNAPETGSPWSQELQTCEMDRPVWCIEDK